MTGHATTGPLDLTGPVLRDVGPTQVTIVAGDLERLGSGYDAVVVSDDNHLSHGGGVSAAIWRAAGGLGADPVVQAAQSGSTRATVGQVIVSGPGDLPLDRILHAVTIDFDQGLVLQPEQVPALYGAVLDAALDHGLRRVALPLLAAGAVGVSPEASARGFAAALAERGLDPVGLEVTLVLLLAERRRETVRAVASVAHPTVPVDQLVDGALELGADEDQALAVRRAVVRLQQRRPPALRDALALCDAVRALPRAEELRRRSTTFQRALEARERLVSATAAAPGVTALRPVVSGLLRVLASAGYDGRPDRVPGGATSLAPRDDLSHPDDAAPPAGEVIEPPRAVRTGPRGADDGTAHVRALRDLLADVLEPEVLQDVIRDLRTRRGYRGRDDSRALLELCAKEDPDQILQEYLTGPTLRRILRERGVALRPDETPLSLRRLLLRELGFPAPDPAPGVPELQHEVERTRREIDRADDVVLRGRVVEIATAFERLLRVYLRFLCMAAFGQAPEQWAHDRLPTGIPYSRATMGTLVGLVSALEKDIRASTLPACIELRAEMGGDGLRLIPPDAQRIAALRNQSLHANEMVAALSGQDLQSSARRLCDEVEAVLDHWSSQATELFPRVVTIQEVRVDRWGRRSVVGLTSDGLEESIFTDEPMRPGQRYLMRRLTNPWSVDPISVPLGDADRLVTE